MTTPHDPGAWLKRDRLLSLISSTPDGGTCLLLSQPGFGRRTLLESALRSSSATLALPPAPLDRAAWRSMLVELVGAAAGTPWRDAVRETDVEWLAVLDVDAALHAELLPDLEELAASCPPGLRIALTASPAAGAALSRVRGSRRLVLIEDDDLSLDAAEARDLLGSWAQDLDASVVDEVVALCDGWVRPLVSAGRYAQAHPSPELLPWLRTHGAERALGPWLDGLSDSVRDMLLDSSILAQLHPGLVDAVCGPQEIPLSALATPRGPLRPARRPLTPDGPWFDRHPMLTSYLRYLAAGRAGESQRHRRAADWLQQAGAVGQELDHRLQAGDAEDAVDRLHRHEDELLQSGLAQLALRWYQALPAGEHAPQDLLRVAWAHALSGRRQESRRTLDQLRVVLRAGPQSYASAHPQVSDLEGEAELLAAWLHEFDGDLVRMRAAATRARALFGEAWSRNAHQLAPLLQARAALHLGDHPTAYAVLVAVREEPFLSGAVGEGRRAAVESELAWVRGEVVRARAWAARHDRWAREQERQGVPGWSGPGSLVGFLAAAEAGDLGHAAHGLWQLVERARSTGNVTDETLSLLGLASVLAQQRGPRAGLEAVAVARQLVLDRSPDGGLLSLVAAREAGLRLAGGDPGRAERLLRGLEPTPSRQLLLARAALQRRLPSAASGVRSLVATSPREEATHRLLLAWAAMATSHQRAETLLLQAADVCVEQGMVSLLVDAPAPLLEVARSAASYHVHDPLQQLVARADQVRRAAATTAAPGEAGLPVGVSLTRGDLQLLALLPTRASNAQIAEQLGISVNTVKTRLRRLYAKLGAHDRDDALVRARGAGLLTDA